MIRTAKVQPDWRRSGRVRILLAIVVVLSSSVPASAEYCGYAISSGTRVPNSTEVRPLASDVMYILRTVNGLYQCPLCVCDVDSSGAIVATDALAVLWASVGIGTLNCDPTEGSECTACNQSSVKSVLQAIPATLLTDNNGGGAGKHVIIACDVDEVLEVTDSFWGDGAVVDESSRRVLTPITVRLDPPCYARCLGRCIGGTDDGNDCTRDEECRGTGIKCEAAGTCSGGELDGDECGTNTDCVHPQGNGTCTGYLANDLPTVRECTSGCATYGRGVCGDGHGTQGGACPDINSGGRFMEVSGDLNVIEGFRVEGFFDGIGVSGLNNTLGNLFMDRQCDDSMGNLAGGLGNEVVNSVIQQGCDKCTQDSAGPPIDSNTCTGRGCYHMAYRNVDFLGCKQVLRMTSPNADKGRFLVDGGKIEPLSGFPCVQGINVGAKKLELTIMGIKMDNCYRGIQLGGAELDSILPTYLLHDNLIKYTDTTSTGKDNNRVGVHAHKKAVVDLTENVVVGHGACCNSGTVNRGGVAVSENAEVNILGNDPVGNKICNNVLKNGTTTQEVDNQRVGYTVPAQENWWCNTNAPHGPLGFRGSLDHSNALDTDPFPNIP